MYCRYEVDLNPDNVIDALRVNPDIFRYPTSSDINITTDGSSWYWAVTAIMTLSTFGFVGLSLMVPRRNRIFHYITASITMVAAIAYFTMASNVRKMGLDIESLA